MSMQGMSLVLIGIILLVISAVVLIVFGLSLINSYNSAYFGARCLFSFVDYNVVNTFIAPASYVGYKIGLISSPLSDVSASQTQSSCIQQGNIQETGTTSISQEL